MAIMERPKSDSNPTKRREMTAAAMVDEKFPHQKVFLKLKFDDFTVKSRLKAINELRPKFTVGDGNMERKRHFLWGQELTVFETVDLLANFTDEQIKEYTAGLTSSQSSFFLNQCRNLLNRVGLLQGPFGTGKTTIIRTLVRILKASSQKVLVISSQNSACDNVIEKQRIYINIHNPFTLSKSREIDHDQRLPERNPRRWSERSGSPIIRRGIR